VLQLPLLALQEKIEAELNSNPVLELAEDDDEFTPAQIDDPNVEPSAENIEQKELVVEEGASADDFQRLDSVQEGFSEYFEQNISYTSRVRAAETDKKFEALNNTAAGRVSLYDHLTAQWLLIEADELVKQAGSLIIDYIDDKGYLTVRLEQLCNKDKYRFTIDHLNKALDLIQLLEPTGVGARSVQECFLIQLVQQPEDMSLETTLVEEYWDELLDNKLPQIAKKLKISIEQLNTAIHRMSKFDTSPGLLMGKDENHPITADVKVEEDPEGDGYIVSLADASIPDLRVNDFYTTMSRDKKIDSKTREFLSQNINSAQWLMDAIVQRKNTLLRVARAVVANQRQFFDKGQLFLKPLPMATIADEVGVHIATVSRAVAGKYIQCSQGVLPLRSLFSGGTEDTDGNMHSWDAVKAELQNIIDAEDKSKPLNDDRLQKALAEKGITDIARRTVAKYRKLMNIPAARLRKKY
ncbi:MAG: RNA polymerase factor sigma-54, partial [Anaerohalosphaera sp.]|nr:RNA polymerase factor sigma-54 [Anaerohalosphaera sp.]